MIRVLHSVSNMDRAGIETMVMNFYRNMDSSRVQFAFLANKPKPGAYEDEIAKLGGKVYRTPGYNPLKFPAYVRFMKGILAENPDISTVHVHNGALGAYALLAAKLCGVKNRAYHAHGCQTPQGRGHLVKKMLMPLIPRLSTVHLACGIDAARFYYGEKNIKNGRYQIIRNAIELERFAYNEALRRETREKFGLEGRTVIGHIGRFSPQKNHMRILSVFARTKKLVPNAMLVLIGEGELEQSVKDKAREMGLENDVLFVPPVSDTSPWYQAMDLFLLPSVWEGLPVVAIEAQASGLPCVLSGAVTKEAGVTQAVRYIDLDKPDDIWAKEIEGALTEKRSREGTLSALREAGYDIRAEAKKLQTIYERLAANK